MCWGRCCTRGSWRCQQLCEQHCKNLRNALLLRAGCTTYMMFLGVYVSAGAEWLPLLVAVEAMATPVCSSGVLGVLNR